jgi:ADP-heptose:LPS heptosyltransferase
MTTPMLRAIRTAMPDAVTHVCVESSSAQAVRSNPYVDQVVFDGPGSSLRLVSALRRARYDVVIDSLGTPGSARLAYLTSAPVRIGLAKSWRRIFYTSRIPVVPLHRYSALEKLELLEPLGIQSTDCRIELFPTEEECREADGFWSSLGISSQQCVVALSPVSRRSRKVWPAERFAEVCDRWTERAGLRYLPVFGPGEEPLVERVISRLRHSAAVIYPCRSLSFGALVPLMQRCRFYFGNDNGIRHAAIAAGIPSAAVFGPPNPISWTPPGSTQHFCVGGNCAVDAVSTDEVDAMMARLIDTCGLGRRSPSSGAENV